MKKAWSFISTPQYVTRHDVQTQERILLYTLHLMEMTSSTEGLTSVQEIIQYQKKWLQHVQRMDTNRIPRQALRYRPQEEGKWDGQRKDGWTNSTLRIKEQETRLNFMYMMMMVMMTMTSSIEVTRSS
jgi:hypothetical protein